MKKFHVGIKAIIQDPGRGILFIKNIKGFWDIPGGRIDGDESIEQTMKRELAEELPGTKLRSIISLEGAFRLHKDVQEDTSLVLLYHLVDANVPNTVVLSEEHTDMKWVKTAEEIPDLSWTPQLKEIIEKLLSPRNKN